MFLWFIFIQPLNVEELTMTAQLQKNWSFIQLLTQTSAIQQKALLKTLTDNQLSTLCEVILNILKGNLHLSADIIQKIKRYRSVLRNLSSKSASNKTKKTSLVKNQKLIVYILQTVKTSLENYLTKWRNPYWFPALNIAPTINRAVQLIWGHLIFGHHGVNIM